MTSFLKKFQMQKKKGADSSESRPEDQQQQRDVREAHFSGYQPSTSALDPANQRTSQLLPLLVKPPAVSADTKKKAQALVLPELVQRQPKKASGVTSRTEEKHLHRTPAEMAKDQVALTKEKMKKGGSVPVKKKPPESAMPVYPELSDEQFRFLWEKKTLRGRTLKESLEMMDEREVLDTILAYLFQSLQIPLYKYYGVKLRDSKHEDVVSEYLLMLLRLAPKDEADREGIAEAIGLVAFCHLTETLVVLREYGHMIPGRRSMQSEPSESRNISERQIRTTVILCYGQAALGAKPEEMLTLLEFIVSEILFQFRGENKDVAMKKVFMRSVIMISKALLRTKREDAHIPHKCEIALCITRVIEEEPLGSFSVAILHQAMITVTCMTSLRPSLDSEVRSELVNRSVKKVFSLPALNMTKLKAGSPMHPVQTQDYYHQTVTACQNMLTGLVSETPSLESLQDILIHTNGWIDSPKIYERERAVRSTRHLLKFVAEHLNFDMTPEFFLLGQLVSLLALHIADHMKEIAQASAEAIYYLHYIIISKMAKDMEKKPKNKKGNIVKWLREDFFISGPMTFYNNISKVAKAFGEHLSNAHITEIVLNAIDNVTNEDKGFSQAAGVLLSSFLEECGKDMEDLPMIVKEIYTHLSKIKDPFTKEETMKALRSLAAKRLNGVVDVLLECSVECDDSVAEMWKALVCDPYSNVKLIRPLLKRLQDEGPVSDVTYRRHSKSQMPLAATNALCLILSLPEAAEALQNKFPHLLIALVTQIYFVLGTSRRGSKRPSVISDIFVHPTPLSTAVQALKNLITCAGYIREYNVLGMQGCWDLLSSPENFFEGIFHLVRTLFTFTKVHLKVTFKQANAYLRHSDFKERIVGMAFFTELLVHPEVSLFFVKQDILDVLRDWMTQASPIMQVFSIRGLGYLLQQPLEDEVLEPFLSPLISCAFDPDRNMAKESIRTLQYIFQYLDVEEYGFTGTSLIPHLMSYFNDEDNDLRRSSIVVFGTLLKGVKENHQNSVAEDVLRSLVPLLIQLTDSWTREASQVALYNCANFMKWGDIPKDLFDYGLHATIYSTYLNISRYIIWRYTHKLSEMLGQMVQYLNSRNPPYREAAAILIACNARHMIPDVVTSKEVETIFLALRELQDDCDPTVADAAVEALVEVFRHCGYRISPHVIPSQLMATLRKNMAKQPFEDRH
ncbi:maestro heat-like repeat family member 5 [Elgaria multicarinata webbii]|uniref:maestro heat-like repeat family member 5 n=1 Tax=Elgaria multicarinata webbii TaxID=159646 RepID=UPI002FCCBBAE